MKIGTDGVLLGAWTEIPESASAILDIGAGTGIIALMLAQRSYAEQIDALELDDDAFEQATENFEASLWADRLFCYHAHLYEFATEMEDKYDLIICNPPFFAGEAQEASTARNLARFEDAMPFDLLVGAAAHLLKDDGLFSVVLPKDREEEFVSLSAKAKLFPKKITTVKGNASAEAKRVLITLSKTQVPPMHDELVMEISRHNYTEAYTELVKDFYLKM
ncbi:MAG: methyltransferase [Leeuwenhoekiella sp.]